MTDTIPSTQRDAIVHILGEVENERYAQLAKWGVQHHRDGTGFPADQDEARTRRDDTETAAAEGHLAWRHILLEEVAEAIAESDQAALRAELVQVAAVAAAWVEDIDSRRAAVADAGQGSET